MNTRALLGDFSALEIQVLRFALGWLALGVAGRFEGFGRFREWREELLLASLGFFGVAVYQLLENCAIHFTNASNVSILVCMCPLLTGVVSRLFFRHRPGEALGPMFFVGFVLAIAGVTMVSMDGIREFNFNPSGDLLAALAMLCWAVYSNLVAVAGGKGRPRTFVIRRSFFWALVFMIPLVAFGITPSGASALDGSLAVVTDATVNTRRFSAPLNYLNLGFLGLLASALCFVLWSRALAALGTVRCTVMLYLQPGVTVVFAYLFLGEVLTIQSAAGGALILVGVIVSGKGTRR